VSRFEFTVVIAVGMVACGSLDGQEPPGRGTVIVELAGNAALGATVNAELWLGHGMGVRGGAGMDFLSSTTVFPLQAVMLLGSGHSKFELAAGITVAHEDEANSGNWHWDGTKAFFSGFLGYRHQVSQGFLLRAGVVPLLWPNRRLPWVAIGFGTTF
jgi:hypothetical protein